MNPNLSEAIDVIKKGGVIAHATETCYGLACDLTNPEAVKRLFQIKNRPINMPVSGLFESTEQSKQYVIWNEEAEALADKYLPGPITIILPLLSTLYPTPDGGETLGIRVSDYSEAMELVKEFGVPLTTTSANIHGEPAPYSVKEINEQYEGKDFAPDLILDSGKLTAQPPSTVVDFSKEKMQVLRKGTILI
ncbi:threonylcarbamoyl-AMP synthase [Candidatus Peregrinibacteria bacterium]|jgi:L-threonylcarbamoyladenylate synthase|nr:threonylcarbamoyl-AMP synthase [Candidatus Peregrinibacteria bacterium]MBT3598275.1 threonylcarbamoyl-AMP synthase [Candidatus Peregrinibacteria bacterium]MBT4367164.1 threonylcarbamoyl-AMP synthase [Candidatus Peregrinibacteria bacterium]MBT4585313.1 threonylcarbamoyl-AMP synthase [Candidatus Peregrinibacteria bacterium]MBT6731052.1 threonylcarbamoyl-AMP synthase [Candidatus Peregrinibacteria bacterium]